LIRYFHQESNQRKFYPLTSSQEQIMVVEPVRKWIPSYNVPYALKITGELSEKLEESLNY
jgi:hypothetical protein